MEVVLGMLFFTSNNTDVYFAKQKLTWKIYTTKEALSTIHQVEIIDRKEFANPALDENVKTFVVHVSSLRSKMSIHLARKA